MPAGSVRPCSSFLLLRLLRIRLRSRPLRVRSKGGTPGSCHRSRASASRRLRIPVRSRLRTRRSLRRRASGALPSSQRAVAGWCEPRDPPLPGPGVRVLAAVLVRVTRLALVRGACARVALDLRGVRAGGRARWPVRLGERLRGPRESRRDRAQRQGERQDPGEASEGGVRGQGRGWRRSDGWDLLAYRRGVRPDASRTSARGRRAVAPATRAADGREARRPRAGDPNNCSVRGEV